VNFQHFNDRSLLITPSETPVKKTVAVQVIKPVMSSWDETTGAETFSDIHFENPDSIESFPSKIFVQPVQK